MKSHPPVQSKAVDDAPDPVKKVSLRAEGFDFRSFDLRATAVCKIILIFAIVYLLFILLAAWNTGAFDRLVR